MKIGVTGCTGRVGSLITKELLSGDWKELELAGGTVLNEDEITDDFFMTTDAEDLFARADTIIDFTSPRAVPTHTELAAKHGTILIISTSGLSEADEALVKQAATNPRCLCRQYERRRQSIDRLGRTGRPASR